MAHSTTHDEDFTVEQAMHEIKADRARKAWIAAILFVLSGAAIVTSFYFSYR